MAPKRAPAPSSSSEHGKSPTVSEWLKTHHSEALAGGVGLVALIAYMRSRSSSASSSTSQPTALNGVSPSSSYDPYVTSDPYGAGGYPGYLGPSSSPPYVPGPGGLIPGGPNAGQAPGSGDTTTPGGGTSSSSPAPIIVPPPAPNQVGQPIPSGVQAQVPGSNSGYYGEAPGYSPTQSAQQNQLAQELYAAQPGSPQYHALLSSYNASIGA